MALRNNTGKTTKATVNSLGLAPADTTARAATLAPRITPTPVDAENPEIKQARKKPAPKKPSKPHPEVQEDSSTAEDSKALNDSQNSNTTDLALSEDSLSTSSLSASVIDSLNNDSLNTDTTQSTSVLLAQATTTTIIAPGYSNTPNTRAAAAPEQTSTSQSGMGWGIWAGAGAGAVVGALALGGGNGGGNGDGKSTDATPTNPPTPPILFGPAVTIQNIGLGPLITNDPSRPLNLTATVYAADGKTRIGTGSVDAQGKAHFTLDYAYNNYSGAAIVKITGTASYQDEATNRPKHFDSTTSGPMLAALVLIGGGAVTVNVNPLTTFAAIEAGVQPDGSVDATKAAFTADTVKAASTQVARLVGLTGDNAGDRLIQITPIFAIGNSVLDGANLSTSSDAAKVGTFLALVSGLEKSRSTAATAVTTKDVIKQLNDSFDSTKADMDGKAIAPLLLEGAGQVSVLGNSVNGYVFDKFQLITVGIQSDKPQLKVDDTANITFTFSVDPGSTFDATDIVSVGGSLGTLSGSGTTRTATFTPDSGLDSGTASITVKANSYTGAGGTVNNGQAGSSPSISYDTKAPTLAITSSASAVKVGETATITFTFSEDPGTSFVASDIVTTGGTLAGLSATGLVRTAIFTPMPGIDSTTASITVATGNYTDTAGNDGGAGTAPMLSVDTKTPTLAINSERLALKIGETATITFTFSEDPGSSFSWDGGMGDVSVTGGTLGALSGSGTTRTATFTPTDDLNAGSASISVASGTFTDAAGNDGTGASASTINFDTMAPAAPTLAVGAGVSNGATAAEATASTGVVTVHAESSSTVRVTFTDNAATPHSVVKTTTGTGAALGVTLDSADLGTGAAKLLDGTITVTATATDVAGNVSTAGTGTFTLDTVAPTLTTISSDRTALKKGETATITFTFSEDPGSSFSWDGSMGDVSVMGGTLGSLSSNSGAVRTATFTPTDDLNAGSASISVANGTFTDAAGNPGTGASASTINFDTMAPAAPTLATGAGVSGGATAAEATASTGVVTVHAESGSRVLVTFTDSDSPAHSVVKTATGTGAAQAVTLASTDLGTGAAKLLDGTITVSATATDVAGNISTAGTGTFTLDTVAPTLAITSSVSAVKVGETATITFTFSEAPTGFDSSDITVTGGTLGTLSGSGTTRTATFTPTANTDSTTASITVAANGYTDAAGNSGGAGTTPMLTVDTKAPTLAITSSVSAVKAGETATITFTFSEAPTGFDSSDIVTTGGTLGTLSGSGTTRTATFTPTANIDSTTASITVAANSYTDAAGNNGGAGTTPMLTVDTKAPTLAITSSATAVKVGETATITFTFSEAPTGFDSSDITVTGGTLGTLSGSGTTRTATFTPTANTDSTTASITVAANSYTDAAGNNGGAGTTPMLTVDTKAPTLTIASDRTALKKGETATITFTFSEDPGNSFIASDITLPSGGQISDLTTTGAVRTATFTPTDDVNAGSASISVADGTFTDAAGNPGTGASALSISFDTRAPAAPTLAPGAGVSGGATAAEATASTGVVTVNAESGSTVRVTFTDNAATPHSVVKTATGTGAAQAVTLANTDLGTGAARLLDGTITVSASATDVAGNISTAGTGTFTLDAVAPTLAITSSVSAVKAGETATITFTFSEAPTGFDSSDIVTTGGTLGTLSGNGTTRTATFTPTVNIDSTTASITVAANGYTDAAGNSGGAGTTPMLTVDTKAPTLAITSSVSAVKAGETATITFTFSEAPTGFDSSDIVTTGGTLGTLSGSGTTRTATFTPTANIDSTTASITVAANSYTDAAGNNGGAGTTPMLTVDTKAPTLAITSSATAVKVGETATITFTFSEAPTGFDSSDITVTGGILGTLSGSGTTRTATFTPTANTDSTTASITVAANSYTDAAGNNGGAGTTPMLTVDTKAPTLTIASDRTALKKGETATITFTFSEDPGNSFIASDITLPSGGQISDLTTTGAVRTATFTPTDDVNAGSASISVADGTFTDAAGNPGTGASALSISFDTRAPAAPTLAPGAGVSGGATAAEATASTGVVTVNAESGSTVRVTFTDNAATPHSVVKTATGTGAAQAVTLANTDLGTGAARLLDGTITVSASATDVAGNISTAGTGTFTLDAVAPTLAITSSVSAVKAGETATITFTFSEAPTGFDSSDIVTTGGTLGTLSGNGTTRTATFTPTVNIDSTTASITVAANGYTDAAGNNGGAGTTPMLSVDTKAPILISASLQGTSTVTLTFDTDLDSNAFTGITQSNINSLFSFKTSASSGGTYTAVTNAFTAISVTGSTVILTLGNSAYTSGHFANISYSGSASDQSAGVVQDLVGNDIASFADYTIITTPFILGFAVSDAGNSNGTALGKAGETVTVAVTFSEPVSLTVNSTYTVRVQVGSNPSDGFDATFVPASATSASSYTFSGTLPSATGLSTSALQLTNLTVPAGASIVGNQTLTQTTYSLNSTAYTVDSKAPTLAITSSVSTVKAGETATITFTFSEDPTGFDSSDITVNYWGDISSGTLGALSGNGTTRTATFTPTANIDSTTVSITVAGGANSYTDAAGNTGTGGSTPMLTVDTRAPRVTGIAMVGKSEAIYARLNAGDTVDIAVTFHEAVTITGSPRVALTVGSSMVYATFDSGNAGNSSTKKIFRYTVQAGDTDANGISIAANALSLNGGSISDAAGNAATIAHSITVADNADYIVDNTAPTAPTLEIGSGVTGDVSLVEATASSGVLTVLGESGAKVLVTFTDSAAPWRRTYTKTVVGNGATPVPVVLTDGEVAVLSTLSLNWEHGGNNYAAINYAAIRGSSYWQIRRNGSSYDSISAQSLDSLKSSLQIYGYSSVSTVYTTYVSVLPLTINVTATVTDAAGNTGPAVTSSFTLGTKAPTLTNAYVQGSSVTLTFDSPLDSTALSSVNANSINALFSFKTAPSGSSTYTTVSNSFTSLAVNGNTVTLTLATALGAGESAKISYSDSTGDQATGVVQDIAGNDLASFGDTPVITSPVISGFVVSDTVSSNGTALGKGGEAVNVSVTFSEAVTLAANQTYTVRVKVGGGVGFDATLVTTGSPSAAATYTFQGTLPTSTGLFSNDLQLSLLTLPSGTSIVNASNQALTQTSYVLNSNAYTVDTDISPPVLQLAAQLFKLFIGFYIGANAAETTASTGVVTVNAELGSTVLVTFTDSSTPLAHSIIKTLTGTGLMQPVTLTASDLGSAASQLQDGYINVRAIATDLAGNVSSAGASGFHLDSMAPVLKAPNNSTPVIYVVGDKLTLNFDSYLDYYSSHNPAASAFTVMQTLNGGTASAVGVSDIFVNGSQVVLTLASRIDYGSTVTLAYADPSANDDVNAIQDWAGNDLASFGSQPVTVLERPRVHSVVFTDSVGDTRAGKAGTLVYVQLTFTEPVTVTGSPIFNFRIGSSGATFSASASANNSASGTISLSTYLPSSVSAADNGNIVLTGITLGASGSISGSYSLSTLLPADLSSNPVSDLGYTVDNIAPANAPTLALGAGVFGDVSLAEVTASSGVVTVLGESGVNVLVTFTNSAAPWLTYTKTVVGNGSTPVPVVLTNSDASFLDSTTLSWAFNGNNYIAIWDSSQWTIRRNGLNYSYFDAQSLDSLKSSLQSYGYSSVSTVYTTYVSVLPLNINVTATVTDAAGNTSPVATSSFTLDTRVPTLALGAGVSGDASTAEATASTGVVTVNAELGSTVLVTFTDSATPIAHRIIKTLIGTGSSQPVILNPSDLGNAASQLQDGRVAVSAIATDLAGNVSTAASSSFTLDTLAPFLPTLALGTGVLGDVSLAEATASSGVVTVLGESGAAVLVTFTDTAAPWRRTYTKTVVGNGSTPVPVVLTDGEVAVLSNLSLSWEHGGNNYAAIWDSFAWSIRRNGSTYSYISAQSLDSLKSRLQSYGYSSVSTVYTTYVSVLPLNINVTATVTDAAGNTGPAVTSSFTLGTKAPTLTNAYVQGSSVTLTFDSPLDSTALSSVNASSINALFSFKTAPSGSSTYTTVSNAFTALAVNGNTVTLTLATALGAGESAKISYSDSTGDQATGVVQDIAGNDLASFGDTPVITSPVISGFVVSDTVSSNGTALGKGGEAVNVAVTFSEAVTLAANRTYTVRVKVGGGVGFDATLVTTGSPSAAATYTFQGTLPTSTGLFSNDLQLSLLTLPSGTSIVNASNQALTQTSYVLNSNAYTVDTDISPPVLQLAAQLYLGFYISVNAAETTASTGVVTVNAELGSTVLVTFTDSSTPLAHSIIKTLTGTGLMQPVTWTASDLGSAASQLQDGYINVRAIATDLAGNVSSAGASWFYLDSMAPVLKAPNNSTPVIYVVGDKLTLNFDSRLAYYYVFSAFTVIQTPNGGTASAVGVSDIFVNGSQVVLTLASRIDYGSTVTLAYADPSANDDVNAIQDWAGNDLASFGSQPVTVLERPRVHSVVFTDSVGDTRAGKAGTLVYVQLTFTEPVTVTGSPIFNFRIGSSGATFSASASANNSASGTISLSTYLPSSVSAADNGNIVLTGITLGASGSISGSYSLSTLLPADLSSNPVSDLGYTVDNIAPANAPTLALGAGVFGDVSLAEVTASSGVVTVLGESGVNVLVTFTNSAAPWLTYTKTVVGNGSTPVPVVLTNSDASFLDSTTLSWAFNGNNYIAILPVLGSSNWGIRRNGSPYSSISAQSLDSLKSSLQSYGYSSVSTVYTTYVSVLPLNINVTATVTDAAGNTSPVATSSFTLDTRVPTLAYAYVKGSSVTLTFDSPLDSTALSSVNASGINTLFRLKTAPSGSSTYTTVSNAFTALAVNGNTVTLTLATALGAGVSAKITYSDSTGDQSTGVVQDLAGNDLASFGDTPVITTPLIIGFAVSDTVSSNGTALGKGGEAVNVSVTFSEAVTLAANRTYTVRVKVGGGVGFDATLVTTGSPSAAATYTFQGTLPTSTGLFSNDLQLSLLTLPSGTSIVNASNQALTQTSYVLNSNAYTVDTDISPPVLQLAAQLYLGFYISVNAAETTASTGVVTVNAELGSTVLVTFTDSSTPLAHSIIKTLTGTGLMQPVTWTASDLGSAASQLQDGYINVRAIATDLAGNVSSAGASWFYLDSMAPVLKAPNNSTPVIYVVGDKLTLNFDSRLAYYYVFSAFTVIQTPNGGTASAVGVSDIFVNGSQVVLTLASRIDYGSTVTLAYADPSANDDVNAIQDWAGNDLASFGSQPVTVLERPRVHSVVFTDSVGDTRAGKAGTLVYVQLTFTEPVTVTGSPIFNFRIGSSGATFSASASANNSASGTISLSTYLPSSVSAADNGNIVLTGITLGASGSISGSYSLSTLLPADLSSNPVSDLGYTVDNIAPANAPTLALGAGVFGDVSLAEVTASSGVVTVLGESGVNVLVTFTNSAAPWLTYTKTVVGNGSTPVPVVLTNSDASFLDSTTLSWAFNGNNYIAIWDSSQWTIRRNGLNYSYFDAQSLDSLKSSLQSYGYSSVSTVYTTYVSVLPLNINVTATVTDAAGNTSPVATSSFTLDTRVPTLAYAYVKGSSVTLTFDSPLDSTALSSVNASGINTLFRLKTAPSGSSTYTTVSNAFTALAVNGNTVTLTLATALGAGVSAKITYSDSTGDQSTGVVQDLAGNDLASFGDTPVITTPLIIGFAVSDTVSSNGTALGKGGEAVNVSVTFSEAVTLAANRTYTVRVKVGGGVGFDATLVTTGSPSAAATYTFQGTLPTSTGLFSNDLQLSLLTLPSGTSIVNASNQALTQTTYILNSNAYTVDTVAPNSPMLAFGEGISGGATATEATASTGVVNVYAEPGSTVMVTFTDSSTPIAHSVVKTLTGTGLAQPVTLNTSDLGSAASQLQDGNVVVRAIATDLAGNVSSVTSSSFLLDTHAPSLNLSGTSTVITAANVTSFNPNSAILPSVSAVPDSDVVKIVLDFNDTGSSAPKQGDLLKVGSINGASVYFDLTSATNLSGTGLTLGSQSGLDYSYDAVTHVLSLFKHDGTAYTAANIASSLGDIQFMNASATPGTRNFTVHLIDEAGNDAMAAAYIVI